MKKRAIVGIIFLVVLVAPLWFSVAGTAITMQDGHTARGSTDAGFLTTYDFNGITAPSSRHKACYQIGLTEARTGPPHAGPEIENATEFTTADYTKISSQDDARVITTSSVGRPLQWFQFAINESPTNITNLYVHWYGHASVPTDLYIWNYHTMTWELVGVDHVTSTDAAISKTYINDVAEYIEPITRHLTLVAVTHTTTRASQSLSTNYVQLKVGNPSTTTLKDDAYHFHDERAYLEWWFFQVVDPGQDVQFYITYYLMSPANGFAAMNMGVFEQDKSYEITQFFPINQFVASYETPAVSIGSECRFDALDDSTFIVQGSLDDGTYNPRWNLTFSRTAPPYDFTESPGETQYLCYLPGASVNGTMTLRGVTYALNGSYGYHDHNWGGRPHVLSQWAWAAVCDPAARFALVMEKVEHFTWHTRGIFVTVGDQTIYFEDITTTFKDFIFDRRPSFPFFTYYPGYRHIEAVNRDGYTLVFDATVQKNLPIWFGIPHILNEQISLFQGTLSKNGQTLYSFQVLGFTDYSTY